MKIKDFIKILEGYPEDMEIFTRSDTKRMYIPSLEKVEMGFYNKKGKDRNGGAEGAELYPFVNREYFILGKNKIVLAIEDET